MVADSVAILMQRTPKQLDNLLPDCYQKVMQLEGVQGVQVQDLVSFKEVVSKVKIYPSIVFYYLRILLLKRVFKMLKLICSQTV